MLSNAAKPLHHPEVFQDWLSAAENVTHLAVTLILQLILALDLGFFAGKDSPRVLFSTSLLSCVR